MNQWETLLDQLPCGFVSFAEDGTVLLANGTLLGVLGRAPHEVLGRPVEDLLSLTGRIFCHTHVFPLLKIRGAIEEIYLALLSEQGEEIPVLINGVRRQHGETTVNDWVIMPMRQRSRYEDTLLQAKKAAEEAVRAKEQAHRTLLELQKLESLSVLAGGIAHDFNNLLSIVLGHTELALLELPADDPLYASMEQIRLAGRRAAELTVQMLAYSGRGRLIGSPLDLATLVGEMAALLRALVPKEVLVEYSLGTGLPLVEADAAQLRQVVINLVLNAAEAMGGRVGQITVWLGQRQIEQADFRGYYLSPALPSGRYVVLEVTDTGDGMAEATQARIFEPFFTTKAMGRGLGLSAVLGTVRAHQGAIQVASFLGQGTIVTLLLPAVAFPDALVSAAQLPEPQLQLGADVPTVLVIDDEAGIRQLATRMLERIGYRVVSAASGQEGLDQLAAQPAIGCVLLDLTMPGLSGEETLQRLRVERPHLPVIVVSGYGAQEVRERLSETPVRAVLQKPFSLAELRQAMRGLSDAVGE